MTFRTTVIGVRSRMWDNPVTTVSLALIGLVSLLVVMVRVTLRRSRLVTMLNRSLAKFRTGRVKILTSAKIAFRTVMTVMVRMDRLVPVPRVLDMFTMVVVL